MYVEIRQTTDPPFHLARRPERVPFAISQVVAQEDLERLIRLKRELCELHDRLYRLARGGADAEAGPLRPVISARRQLIIDRDDLANAIGDWEADQVVEAAEVIETEELRVVAEESGNGEGTE